MRICIINDVHLDTVWKQIFSYLQKNKLKFDYVVVNGDLTSEFEVPKRYRVKDFRGYIQKLDKSKRFKQVAPKSFETYQKLVKSKEIDVSKLSDFVKQYICERQDKAVSYLKKLKKYGTVLFNLGNHDTTPQMLVLHELALLSGLPEEICIKVFRIANFDPYERLVNLISKLGKDGKLKDISAKQFKTGKTLMVGIPGFWYTHDRNQPAQLQEAITAKALEKLKLSETNLIFNHMIAPPVFSYQGKWNEIGWTGSLTLGKFIRKNKSKKLIVINAHMHFSLATYIKCKDFHYFGASAGLNDGVITILDLEKMKFTEIDTSKNKKYEIKPFVSKTLDSKPSRDEILNSNYKSYKKVLSERGLEEDS